MNLSLPTLPVWQARSFWAQLLLLASVLLNGFGIDLMGLFQAMGLGDNPDAVIDTSISIWQAVAPVIFGFWAWWERRAPNYRLVWPWSTGGVAAAVAVVGMTCFSMWPGPARADVERCDDTAALLAAIEDEWGEQVTALGIVEVRDMMMFLTTSPDGGWSFILSTGGRACIIGTGRDFRAVPTGDVL